MRNLISYPVYFLFLFSIIITGCGSGEKNLGKNFTAGVSMEADTLSSNLIKGFRDELANPKTQKVITGLLDSIINNLGDTAEPKIKGIVATVINHKIILWSDSIVEVLTGKQVLKNVAALQHTFVGQTKTDVIQIEASFKQLLDNVLSAETDTKLGKIRDELLGAKTDSAISQIADHAALKVVNQIKYNLNPAVKNDVSYVGKYGGYLLLLTGGIATAIIFIIWWNKRRYLQMVTLLTKHIHNIPDQATYDRITGKIQDEAITTGLEPHLRKLLTANGLIGNPHWKAKQMDY